MLGLMINFLTAIVPKLRDMAASTITRFDDIAVDVLEAILKSSNLSRWLKDTALTTTAAAFSPEDCITAMSPSVRSEFTAAGFDDVALMKFLFQVLPYVRGFMHWFDGADAA